MRWQGCRGGWEVHRWDTRTEIGLMVEMLRKECRKDQKELGLEEVASAPVAGEVME